MLRLLCFADTHGSFKKLKKLKKLSENVDFVLCAGDFTVMERDIKRLLDLLNNFKAPVLLIPGNHEDEEGLRDHCTKYKNLTYIHKGAHHYNEYVFLGYGGGGFSKSDPVFKNLAENFFMVEIKDKKRIILVLHGPPHGTSADRMNNEYVGDKNYRKFIDKAQPHLVICGHIHENAGKKDKIGRSLIINPGPKGVIVEI